MGVYIGEPYMEVEYIQSSGTQYINTGQSFDCQNTIVEMKFQMPDVSYSSLSSRPRFYGISNGTNEYSLQANRNSITSVTANSYLNNSTYQISATVSKGADHVSKHYASGVWYVDGVSKGSKSHSDYSTGDNPIFIFEVNAQGQAMDRKMLLRIYRFKIYNGNTLQRDFIPCYRISDNEIGLFDKVEKKFYANSGTGTFTKGNDVKLFQPELKNAYIGQGPYEYSYDFRGKSSTILTNDGWTVTGSPTFNSNGMSGNGPSVSRSLPTRNTANKITLTHTFDVRSGGSSLFRIGTMSNGSLTNVSGSYTLQGSYRRIAIANSATNYNGVNNGTYTLVMTLDLVNDIWGVTTTGLSTQTGTITSTQKATILANMNNILADTYSSNGGYLQSLSVRIEY